MVFLVGYYYRDTTDEESFIWANVMAVIPASPENISASYSDIHIHPITWQHMHEKAAEYRTENMRVLGWYRTNQNSTRISHGDAAIQRSRFTNDYSIGVVLSPSQMQWSAYYGPDCQECIGEMILTEELMVKEYRRPQITIQNQNENTQENQWNDNLNPVSFPPRPDQEVHFESQNPEQIPAQEGQGAQQRQKKSFADKMQILRDRISSVQRSIRSEHNASTTEPTITIKRQNPAIAHNVADVQTAQPRIQMRLKELSVVQREQNLLLSRDCPNEFIPAEIARRLLDTVKDRSDRQSQRNRQQNFQYFQY